MLSLVFYVAGIAQTPNLSMVTPKLMVNARKNGNKYGTLV